MNTSAPLILCQPDGEKGCCACCGAFNFKDISRERIERFLADGALRSPAHLESRDDADAGDPADVRDIAAYVCPHQGFIAAEKPGCMLHPLYRGHSERHASFFGEKICDSFLCPAHSLYSHEQKELLIGLIDDWYYYTVAIIDPATVIWILAAMIDKFGIRPGRDRITKKILKASLCIHADCLQSTNAPLFFYSVPEYSLGSARFSLGYGSAVFDKEKSDILAVINKLM